MKSWLGALRRMFSKRKIQASNPAFSGGVGTPDDPFQIRTEADFEQVHLRPEAHFVLVESLRLSRPVSIIPEFAGVLNGNGKTIEGLCCAPNWIRVLEGELIDWRLLDCQITQGADPELGRGVGLVGTNVGKISGVHLRESVVRSNLESHNAGAAAIAAVNRGIIEACSFQGLIDTVGADAAAITVQNLGAGRIRDCQIKGLSQILTQNGECAAAVCAFNFGVVQLCAAENRVAVVPHRGGPGAVGGLVSVQRETGVVALCVNDAEIRVASTEQKGVGGVVGLNHGLVLSCGSSVVIDRGLGLYVGQLVGREADGGMLQDGRLMGARWATVRATIHSTERLRELMVGGLRHGPLVVVPKNSEGGEGTH